MSVIYLLLPLAIVLVMIALWSFIHAAKSGQFDDLHTPALRMLHDDEPVGEKSKEDKS